MECPHCQSKNFERAEVKRLWKCLQCGNFFDNGNIVIKKKAEYVLKDQKKTESFINLTENLANCPHCVNGIIPYGNTMDPKTRGEFLGEYVEKFHGYSCLHCGGKGVVKLTEQLGLGSEKDERGEGMRYNVGKVPIECVPLHLLDGAARVFKYATEREENPYPMWNWARGMNWSAAYACLIRHLKAWYRGEDDDKDTGLNHLHHAMCNLLMLTHYLDAFPEGDDRPKDYFQPGGMKDDRSDA